MLGKEVYILPAVSANYSLVMAFSIKLFIIVPSSRGSVWDGCLKLTSSHSLPRPARALPAGRTSVQGPWDPGPAKANIPIASARAGKEVVGEERGRVQRRERGPPVEERGQAKYGAGRVGKAVGTPSPAQDGKKRVGRKEERKKGRRGREEISLA